MEVLVGPTTTYTMEMDHVPSSASSSSTTAAFVRDRTAAGVVLLPTQDDDDDDSNNDRRKVSTPCLFLTGSEESSDSSSSIGDPGDTDDDVSEEEDKEGEVSSSKLSLDSLEDSLPFKRGLSSHFSGKSKSFANLADVGSSTCSAKDLEKPENPFNKRRRVLIANKWARKPSPFYSSQNPKSMPLLTVHEDQDHGDHDLQQHNNPVAEEEEEEEEEKKNRTRVCGNRLKKKIGFKSQSCFSLADLHEEEYQ